MPWPYAYTNQPLANLYDQLWGERQKAVPVCEANKVWLTHTVCEANKVWLANVAAVAAACLSRKDCRCCLAAV